MHRKAIRIIISLTSSVQGIHKPISTEIYVNVKSLVNIPVFWGVT